MLTRSWFCLVLPFKSRKSMTARRWDAPIRPTTSTTCMRSPPFLTCSYLQNCSGQGARVWYSILWVVILVLLLCLLASTADDYFCVVMDCIVEKLHIPPSIAGRPIGACQSQASPSWPLATELPTCSPWSSLCFLE